jgi:radical SAM protein with 4Fe4S-binding SPASM domain
MTAAHDGALTLDLFARAEDRAVPLSASIALTHACNLACDFCYLPLPRDPTEELTTSEWHAVLEQLAAAGCLFLALTGGEPLLRPDFFEIAGDARALGFALRILTNGTKIDTTVAERIAHLPVLSVELSVHGASPAAHERATHVTRSFEQALAAARHLRARAVPVTLKCVVSRLNVREIDQIGHLAESLGAALQLDAEITPRNDGDPQPTELAASACDLARLADRLWREPGGTIPTADRLDQPPCAAGRRIVHIGASGTVHPCVQWARPVGELRHEPFADVWRDAPMLGHLRALRLRDMTACATCDHLAACAPCPALSLLERGDLSGPSPSRCRTAAIRVQATR